MDYGQVVCAGVQIVIKHSDTDRTTKVIVTGISMNVQVHMYAVPRTAILYLVLISSRPFLLFRNLQN